MEWIGPIFSGISSVFSIFQGVSGKNTADVNAQRSTTMANVETASGKEDYRRSQRLLAAEQSQANADIGASGTTGMGSPMLVYMQNAMQGKIQSLDAKRAHDLKAYAYNIQASDQKRAGSAALVGGIAQAVSTLGQAKFKA